MRPMIATTIGTTISVVLLVLCWSTMVMVVFEDPDAVTEEDAVELATDEGEFVVLLGVVRIKVTVSVVGARVWVCEVGCWITGDDELAACPE